MKFRNWSPSRDGLLAGLQVILIGIASLFCSVSTANDDVDEPEVIEEIVVTGSRLLRPAAESPTPLIVVGRNDLDLKGTKNIADNLNELPVFGAPAATPLTTNTSTGRGVGQNLLDLRNLGSSRTLVLVNGRRHVSGRAGTSAVDINAIPTDFVERVEIITGGASAIYGSEAIAGVVNIITKKDFEGFALNAQGGITKEGDGNNGHISVTYGTRFAEDKGHLMLNAAYSDHGSINSVDRENSEVDKFQNPDGSIRSPAGSGVVVNSLILYPTNTGGFNVVTQGSDGLFTKPLSAEDRYNRIVERKILLPVERKLIAGTFNYDLSDKLSFSAEGAYTDTHAVAESEPIAIGNFWPFGTGGQSQGLLDLPITNPFIPAEILNTIDPAETAIAFFARPLKLGNRVHPVDRTSKRIAAGFNGTVFNDWHWDAYIQYGQTIEDQETNNLVNLGKFVEAINAEIGPDGDPRCINPIARANNCAPYNPFGQDAASQAALEYVRGEALYESTITQKVAAVSISGSPFSLGAGEVLLAAGLEYREEKSIFDVDRLTEEGMLTFGQSLDTIGEYDVTEAFSEISIPLFEELGFISLANFDAALRFADYSTIGSTDSWKVGLNINMLGGFRFRGTFSEATRAPNIGELFLPQSGTGGRLTDPCAGGGNVSGLSPETAATRTANCSALGIDSSFVPDQLSLESTFGVTGGNPNLQEETAETVTVGAVYTPEYLPGFWVTIDYWQISVEDAIGSISRQLTVNQCVDQPTTNNQFCTNVFRDPTSLQIRTVNTFIQNLARQEVTGVDFDFNYEFEVGSSGSAELSLLGTYVFDDELQQFSGSTVQDLVGEIAHPEWKATAQVVYRREPFTLAWSTRFIDSALKDKSISSAANMVDEVWYSDAQIRYEINDDFEVYFGIDNVFDEDAPIIASPHIRADLSSQTASEVYDPIGMRFYLGANVNF